MDARHERALTQRLHFVSPLVLNDDGSRQFHVIGSTGNHYYVAVHQGTTSCTCADYVRRKQCCKHIYFVLCRILKLQTSIWQQGTRFSSSQLEEIRRSCETLTVVAEVTKRRSLSDQPECVICFEEFMEKEALEFCQTCGYNYHASCLRLCKTLACPMCRSVHSMRMVSSSASLPLAEKI